MGPQPYSPTLTLPARTSFPIILPNPSPTERLSLQSPLKCQEGSSSRLEFANWLAECPNTLRKNQPEKRNPIKLDSGESLRILLQNPPETRISSSAESPRILRRNESASELTEKSQKNEQENDSDEERYNAMINICMRESEPPLESGGGDAPHSQRMGGEGPHNQRVGGEAPHNQRVRCEAPYNQRIDDKRLRSMLHRFYSKVSPQISLKYLFK